MTEVDQKKTHQKTPQKLNPKTKNQPTSECQASIIWIISSCGFVFTLETEPANFEVNETLSMFSTDQIDAREN